MRRLASSSSAALLLALAWLCVSARGVAGDPCPADCVCAALTLGRIDVSCTNLGWTALPPAFVTPIMASLRFSNNSLTELPADMLANAPTIVKGLNFEANFITVVHPNAFRFFPILEVLMLADNRIGNYDVALSQFIPQLDTLSLSYNHLTVVPVFPRLGSFRKLYLDGNLIRPLTRAVFAGLTRRLSFLSLRQTGFGLAAVSPDLLRDCASLAFLDLSQNNLTALPDDFFDGTAPSLAILLLQVLSALPPPPRPQCLAAGGVEV